MPNIDKLFADVNVVSTGDVARTFELSEADARAWADELDVAKIGTSYAWAQADVDALSGRLAEEAADDELDGDDDPDEAEDEADDEADPGEDDDQEEAEAE